MNTAEHKKIFIVAFSIAGLFVAAQLFGDLLYSHGWSFNYLSALPGWYSIIWIVAFPLLFIGFVNLQKWESQLRSRFLVAVGVLVLIAILWLLRYDSFLYGGGNLRVAQFSQVSKIIPPWYEWGSVTIVSVFFKVITTFESRANWASIYAWQSLSYVSALATLIAMVLIVRRLADKSAKRFQLFLILFFGGQTSLYFGFVGVESVIVPLIAWFFYFSIRLYEDMKAMFLLPLILLSFGGMFLHVSAAFLIPPAVYFIVNYLSGKRARSIGAIVLSLIVFVALSIAYYAYAVSSFAFSRFVLFLNGKAPFTDYGVFSYLHLTDFIQLLLVASPMIIITIALLYFGRSQKKHSPIVVGWIVTVISGLAYIFVSDPENGMALDFPRFSAYLTPIACLLTFLLSRLDFEQKFNQRALAVITVAALLVPAVFLPSLVRVSNADKFVTQFLTKRELYYRSACLSFRDVYWTHRDMENADRWEALLPVKSIDYMNLRGCSYLVANGDHEEAAKRLYQIIAKLPYWTEPRTVVAQLNIKLGRFDKAKPQIDTCLMLEPYKKEHLSSLYSYYRDLPNNSEAIRTIDYMLTLFPGDPDITTDQMIIMLRSGKPQNADSIATYLLAEDSTRAYPYIIKGMIAENRRDTAKALRHYETFMRYGALQPDTSFVRTRIAAMKRDSL